MAALLDRSSIIEDLELDASKAPTNVYAKFVKKMIKQAIMPRKISIQSENATFDFIASNGEIVAYRDHESSTDVWVNHPLTNSEKSLLGALATLAGATLKEGSVSLSLLDDEDRVELAKRTGVPTPVADSTAHIQLDDPQIKPSEVVSLQDWKQGKSVKAVEVASVDTPIISEFYKSIKDKVKFIYFIDRAGGQESVSGHSRALDEGFAQSMESSFISWNEATSEALSTEPKMIMARGLSADGSVLVNAIDANHYLLAEVETRNFGAVASLWNKATKIKY